ncbi:hypothetical protein V8C42DRAFT_316475 [Trichoderma barbatum]
MVVRLCSALFLFPYYCTCINVKCKAKRASIHSISCNGAQVGSVQTAAALGFWPRPMLIRVCMSGIYEYEDASKQPSRMYVYAGKLNCPCPASLFKRSRVENTCKAGQ